MEKTDILSLTLPELELEMIKLGEKKFRAKQIFQWLHVKQIRDFSEMSNISLELRTKISENFCLKSLNMVRRLESCIDNTVKYLYGLSDGTFVETVLMGIGEPLDNYKNVIKFLELVSAPEGFGLSLRHVTLSTCGIVPKIRELADLKLGLTLSVSLHCPDNDGRSEIMPVNKAYNLTELIEAAKEYVRKTGRRVTYEYAVIDNVNSFKKDAEKLAHLIKGINCHVNLIPVNSVKERDYRSSRESALKFQKYLTDLGINATVRRTLGSDIDAACGQLRREAAGTE